MAAYRRCVALRPDDMAAYHSLGRVHQEVGGVRGIPPALAVQRWANRLQPDNADVLLDIGSLSRADNRNLDSIPSLQRAAALDPGNPRAWLTLGLSRLETGRPQVGEAMLKRVALIDPANQVIVSFNLGHAYVAMGDNVAAVAAYRRALDLGAEIARNQVAHTLIDLGRYDEALAVLAPGLAQRSGDVGQSLELCATAFNRQGRFAEGRQFFEAYTARPVPPGQATFRGECLSGIGDCHLAEGRIADACNTLAYVSGDRSRLFTIKSIAFLRASLLRSGQDAPPRRAYDPAGPALASSTLATHGRFAHNVLEYVMLRLYADRFGLQMTTPEWVGHYAFDLDDPLMPLTLRPAVFPRQLLNDEIDGAPGPSLADRDVRSPLWLFQHHVRHREKVQSWLRLRPQWSPHLDPVMEGLRARGRTVVALHLRRGDFLQAKYPISQTGWYVDWLRRLWPRLDAPVLYIASDDLAGVKRDFAEFSPLSLNDLAEPWQALEFMQDFHVLMQADIVGVSSKSGYSFLAALLNRHARLFAEPDLETGRIRSFAPWVGDTPAPMPFD